MKLRWGVGLRAYQPSLSIVLGCAKVLFQLGCGDESHLNENFLSSLQSAEFRIWNFWGDVENREGLC